MARFITRVELHGIRHDAAEYTKLHAEMEKRGFSRTIRSSEPKTYKLPPAEYFLDANWTSQQVLDAAKQGAAAVVKDYSVLVTESNGSTWYNLQPT